MLEFSDKESKAVILLKMLQQAITFMFETQEGENPRKEVEAIFKKIQKHEVGDLNILICIFMSNLCCQHLVVSKACCQEPSFERPEHVGGTWGLCERLKEGEHPALPSASLCWFSGLPRGEMKDTFSKEQTSPVHAPFFLKTRKHVSWGRQRGTGLWRWRVFFLYAL